MSASSSPTRYPSLPSATARFTATVVLPTPPLPLPTATTCAMPGNGCGPCGTCAPICPIYSTSIKPLTLFRACHSNLCRSLGLVILTRSEPEGEEYPHLILRSCLH